VPVCLATGALIWLPGWRLLPPDILSLSSDGKAPPARLFDEEQRHEDDNQQFINTAQNQDEKPPFVEHNLHSEEKT